MKEFLVRAAGIILTPDDLRPVAMLPLGYPDETPSQKEIKSLGEIIYKEL